jgi:hypothetical protein
MVHPHLHPPQNCLLVEHRYGLWALGGGVKFVFITAFCAIFLVTFFFWRLLSFNFATWLALLCFNQYTYCDKKHEDD